MENSNATTKKTKTRKIDGTLYPAIFLLLGIFGLFEFSGIDLALQDQFYDFSHHAWLVDANSYWPHLCFYKAAKILLITFALLLIASLFTPKILPSGMRHRVRKVDVLIVIATLAIAPSLIAWSKARTNVFCPYELQRYGGSVVYVKVCEEFAPAQKPHGLGHGFPAGHASGGFALLSLAGLAKQRRGRWIGAAIGLTCGTLMGGYQMLKGAHFLSHTLITAIFCWIVFLLLRRLFRATESS